MYVLLTDELIMLVSMTPPKTSFVMSNMNFPNSVESFLNLSISSFFIEEQIDKFPSLAGRNRVG